MADLIIKPNSATGDKLILQDRAGGAVITTADSGAAMASNVTGIPAAGVTGVLPVGVTGGSGLTALASNPTVTLGSNATFPAGHVVKVTKFNLGRFAESCVHANASKSNYNQLGSTTWDVVLKQANSQIFITGYMTMGGFASHGYFDMKRGGTSGSWLGGEDGMFASHKNATDNKDVVSVHWLDSPGTNAATTTLTYVPYVGQWSSTETVVINGYDASNPQQVFYSNFTFFEIAV